MKMRRQTNMESGEIKGRRKEKLGRKEGNR